MATIDNDPISPAAADFLAVLDEQVDRELERRIRAVADAVDFGTPGYRRRGRNPRFPFVPVRNLADGRESQVQARAFADAGDALVCAAEHIDALREALVDKLGDHRHRAVREHHGLPRELDDLRADITAGR